MQNTTTNRTAGVSPLIAVALALVLGLFALVPRDASAEAIITTVAGTGSAGYSGDAGPATAADLNTPTALATQADGAILVADSGNHRVRRIDPAGVVTTVAGSGAAGFTGDDGPALQASLKSPIGVLALPDGAFLVADSGNHRIRRVSPSGVITTVAGTGISALAGDGGPAVAAALSSPTHLALDGTGGILVADTGNDRVRRIAPDGSISTVAGSSEGFAGDGGPAVSAKLSGPLGLAVAADGRIIIADSYNRRVRQVGVDGTITTVVGSGASGAGGDGGPATAAGLSDPTGVALSSGGWMLVSDFQANRVRAVGIDGTVSGIAGTGDAGSAGDAGPALSAQLQGPAGLAVTGSGDLLIADAANHRVRRVSGLSEPAATTPPTPPTTPGALSATPSASEVAPTIVFRDRLAIALATGRIRASAGMRVRLVFAATTAGRASLVVRRGTRTVAQLTRTVRRGRNAITWSGRVRGRHARPGTYRLTVVVRAPDGQQATARTTLTVVRAARGSRRSQRR